jgi:hypothetical protein
MSKPSIYNQAAPIPGTRIGAGRIPYQSNHPGTWGQPHRGTVLALDDKRAWRNTLAFGERVSQKHATLHVKQLLEQGYLTDKVPVLWDFGKILWEPIQFIRSVEEDYAEFEKLREEAFSAENAKHNH